MVGIEPFDARFQEAPLPARDGRPSGLQAFLNRGVRQTLDQHQNQFGSEHEARRQGSRLRDLAQLRPLLFRQVEWFGSKGHVEETTRPW